MNPVRALTLLLLLGSAAWTVIYTATWLITHLFGITL